MSRAASDPSFEAACATRRVMVASAAVAAAFFLGFGGWAATAPLRGAVVAPALVGPESYRKTVQHLEGGIIAEILVHEGSQVAAGAPLVRLDATRFRAEVAELQTRWLANRAAMARLLAEQQGTRELAADEELRRLAGQNAEIARLLAAEAQLLRARRQALAQETQVLVHRAQSERESIRGQEASIASYGRQIALVDEEIQTVERLLRQGLERKPRLLALQRSRAEFERSIATSRSEIERSKEAILETEQQMRALVDGRAAEVAEELAKLRTETGEVQARLKAAQDRLARTEITAPVAGTVVNLRPKTIAGVIEPGKEILDLVPAADRLVLEARVAPADVDEVQRGLPVQVHLLAFRQRAMPRVAGTVDHVSADRLLDPDTGDAYYAVRVSVPQEELAQLDEGLLLVPGMPAEALIMTRERTLLSYLMAPLTDTFRRGLRET